MTVREQPNVPPKAGRVRVAAIMFGGMWMCAWRVTRGRCAMGILADGRRTTTTWPPELNHMHSNTVPRRDRRSVAASFALSGFSEVWRVLRGRYEIKDGGSVTTWPRKMYGRW